MPVGSTRLSRRQALTVGCVLAAVPGAAALAGCRGPVDRAERDTETQLAAETDASAAQQVARTAADLSATMQATGRRHAGLRNLLQPMADRHAEHVHAFSSQTSPPTGRSGRVSSTAKAALRVLLGDVQRSATAARAAAMHVDSGDLAAALAASAACHAQHEVLLSAAAAQAPGSGQS